MYIWVLVYLSLTLWCRCNISDTQVRTGYRSWTHVRPQGRDSRQGEDYFISMLRLQETDLQRHRGREGEGLRCKNQLSTGTNPTGPQAERQSVVWSLVTSSSSLMFSACSESESMTPQWSSGVLHPSVWQESWPSDLQEYFLIWLKQNYKLENILTTLCAVKTMSAKNASSAVHPWFTQTHTHTETNLFLFVRSEHDNARLYKPKPPPQQTVVCTLLASHTLPQHLWWSCENLSLYAVCLLPPVLP